MSLGHILAGLMAGTASFSANAELVVQSDQPTEPPSGSASSVDSDEVDSIVVTGARLPGATIGDIEPEVSLTAEEIEAYGVSNLAELLGALDTVVASGRGRSSGGPPIILLDGVRIGSFREIRRYPPEALQRVDVLPEDAAVRYGYRADQRVVNFVLKPGFQSVGGEIGQTGPSEGGRATGKAEASWLRIGEHRRTSIDASYQRSSKLLESERDILATPLSEPFSQQGAVAGEPLGSEIDPALSGLLGYPATSVLLPDGQTGPLSLADLVSTGPASNDDITPFRTLLPDTDELSFGVTHFRSDGDGRFLTLSLTGDYDQSIALLGLPSAKLLVPAGNPYSPFSETVGVYRYLRDETILIRDADNLDLVAAATMDGPLGDWRYNFISRYTYTKSHTVTDQRLQTDDIQSLVTLGDPSVNPFGDDLEGGAIAADQATLNSTQFDIDGTLTGRFGNLPAGEITATLRGNVSSTNLSTNTLSMDQETSTDLSRDLALIRGTLAIPLLEGGDEGKVGLGDLALDVRAELDHLSDVGALSTYGAGLRWSPHARLTLSASWRTEDGAPTITQLGNPILETPGIQFFDFVNGQSVFITQRTGGNPDLIDDSREVLGLGARFRIRQNPDIDLKTDYTDEQIDNPISAFPTLTDEIEAVFPDRVVRENGALVFVDARPVNFLRQSRREVRTSLDFRKRLGGGPPGRPSGAQSRPPSPRGPQSQAGPQRNGASSSKPNGRPTKGKKGAAPRGRGFVGATLAHTWTLGKETIVAEGGPVLDLLGGAAQSRLGGQPEHQVSLRFRGGYNGIGMRLEADWQSGTTVTNVGNGGVLQFSDLATVDVAGFANFDQRKSLIQAYPWLKGTRLQIGVDNLFGERLDVRDPSGGVPLSYQPDYIDPLGRTIEIGLRKMLY